MGKGCGLDLGDRLPCHPCPAMRPAGPRSEYYPLRSSTHRRDVRFTAALSAWALEAQQVAARSV